MSVSPPKSSSPTPLFGSENWDASTETAATSAASTPPPNALSTCSSEVGESRALTEDEEMKEEENDAIALEESEVQRRLARLEFVLQRSAVFSNVLKERMDEEKKKQVALQAQMRKEEALAAASGKKKRGRPSTQQAGSPNGKRKKGETGEAVSAPTTAKGDGECETDDVGIFQQPSLITGAKLKPYQLEGLQWMVSLDQNGISGILADEMGLGKTLQTISFNAYLREHKNFKPFLVVCPLSVVHNWKDEFTKFAPTIPVCIYHGTPEHRAELRRTVMSLPTHSRVSTKKRKAGRPSKSRPSDMDLDDSPSSKGFDKDGSFTSHFPVVLTTYEMIIRDRTHLQHYKWGYIVVDEGHRLKNLNCLLMKEIKKYESAGRMILTGTPLHNNLAELWSLLNFILPDIFDDLDSFQEWFNLPSLQSSLPTTHSTRLISALHAILKPFLLRRLKADVEMNLPPKKEYVLYAPLSKRQREAYDKVLDGGLREWLIKGGTGGKVEEVKAEVEDEPVVVEEVEPEAESDAEDDDDSSKKKTKKGKGKASKRRVSRRLVNSRRNYDVDGSDDEYFEMLERGELDEKGLRVLSGKKSKEEEEREEARLGREHQARKKVIQVNNMKLQNTVMQLRKVCSHPFLFDWPIDPLTNDNVLGEELVNASGKMMVLDRLLKELFKRGHKVLLFSQFTTMLDIIEDWATDYMSYRICRIDGSTSPSDRRSEMERFQKGGNGPDAPMLFLLSTRAGGLGINLVEADTVIFYDQDWNPQMDAQAQARAHRIGQTRPVLIFRLVSAHTIETKIMQRAGEKRMLEALVIAKGKFKMPAQSDGTLAGGGANNKKTTMAELAASLLRLEGEKIEVVPDTVEGKRGVLSQADLDVLLDRRPEVFEERGVGWGSESTSTSSPSGAGLELGSGSRGQKKSKEEAKDSEDGGAGKKAAFAVYQPPVEEGNEALAGMLGEELPS